MSQLLPIFRSGNSNGDFHHYHIYPKEYVQNYHIHPKKNIITIFWMTTNEHNQCGSGSYSSKKTLLPYSSKKTFFQDNYHILESLVWLKGLIPQVEKILDHLWKTTGRHTR